MSVDVQWYDSTQTKLHVILNSPWDWADLEQALQMGLEMATSSGRMVHFLVEFTGRPERPPQGDTLMHMKRLVRLIAAYPNMGESYLINPNPIARKLIDLMVRLYGSTHRIHLVDSLEHAIASIDALSPVALPER